MVRKRLSSGDRREVILDAAMLVFAEHGYDGAKTHEIAKAAEVSEALLYKHFSSKRVLYRAVLRRLIEEQDANIERFGVPEPSAAGLVVFLTGYFRSCLQIRDGTREAMRERILFASLAGDHEYARLAYKRAVRVGLPALQEALDAAHRAGDLVGKPFDAANAFAFIEHVGSKILITRTTGTSAFPYSGDDTHLLRQTVWFCGRGIGLTEEVLARHFGPLSLSKLKAHAPLRAPGRKAAADAPKRRGASK